MPDHVHILLDLTEDNDASLSTIIRAFKAESARSMNLSSGRRGRVWQAGFHDRIVRSWREAEKLADYIRDNPRRWSAKRER
jgi:REP element-mobilizing transposase RayT